MTDTVTIKFDNALQASAFMVWFCEAGEQDYFNFAEIIEDEKKCVNSFSYDSTTSTITGTNNE
jgi:hypothetical protein